MVNILTEFGGDASGFAATLIKPSSGISLVTGSAVYTGVNSAASTFDSLSFGGRQDRRTRHPSHQR